MIDVRQRIAAATSTARTRRRRPRSSWRVGTSRRRGGLRDRCGRRRCPGRGCRTRPCGLGCLHPPDRRVGGSGASGLVSCRGSGLVTRGTPDAADHRQGHDAYDCPVPPPPRVHAPYPRCHGTSASALPSKAPASPPEGLRRRPHGTRMSQRLCLCAGRWGGRGAGARSSGRAVPISLAAAGLGWTDSHPHQFVPCELVVGDGSFSPVEVDQGVSGDSGQQRSAERGGELVTDRPLVVGSNGVVAASASTVSGHRSARQVAASMR